MTIDVVIVNWNSGDHLRRCLESLATLGAEAALLSVVTIVDNASSDASLQLPSSVQQALPLAIIRNPANLGFAAACNQGAAGSPAEFLLFLNPDMIVRPGCLSAPCHYLKAPKHSKVGIIGVQLLTTGGIVARSCARFPTARSLLGNTLGLDRILPSLFPRHFMEEWAHDENRKVDQVMGAFLFIRRQVFEQIGGFDERFFLYYEDLDLALRAAMHGWYSEFLTEAQAVHFGGGTTSGIIGRRIFYVSKGKIIYALKHFPLLPALGILAATTLVEPAVRLAAALARLRIGEAKETLRGFGLLWLDLGRMLSTHARLSARAPEPRNVE